MWNSTFKKPGQPMKRSAMKRSEKAIGHKSALKAGTKKLRARKEAPTAAQREWMDFVANFGCVVCWLQKGVKTPCAVHHIVEGSRRLGHDMTIGLCDPGHHQGATEGSDKISRHPWKKRFETAYGTEYQLHAYLVEQYKGRIKA